MTLQILLSYNSFNGIAFNFATVYWVFVLCIVKIYQFSRQKMNCCVNIFLFYVQAFVQLKQKWLQSIFAFLKQKNWVTDKQTILGQSFKIWICFILMQKKSLNVNYLFKSKWSQKYFELNCPAVGKILDWLGNGLRTSSTLSQVTGYPNSRVSIYRQSLIFFPITKTIFSSIIISLTTLLILEQS